MAQKRRGMHKMGTEAEEAEMTNQNALRLADQAIANLKEHGENRAVWVVGDTLRQTPNNFFDIRFMEANGAALVGVFDRRIGRRDLAEAIVEAAA